MEHGEESTRPPDLDGKGQQLVENQSTKEDSNGSEKGKQTDKGCGRPALPGQNMKEDLPERQTEIAEKEMDNLKQDSDFDATSQKATEDICSPNQNEGDGKRRSTADITDSGQNIKEDLPERQTEITEKEMDTLKQDSNFDAASQKQTEESCSSQNEDDCEKRLKVDATESGKKISENISGGQSPDTQNETFQREGKKNKTIESQERDFRQGKEPTGKTLTDQEVLREGSSKAEQGLVSSGEEVTLQEEKKETSIADHTNRSQERDSGKSIKSTDQALAASDEEGTSNDSDEEDDKHSNESDEPVAASQERTTSEGESVLQDEQGEEESDEDAEIKDQFKDCHENLPVKKHEEVTDSEDICKHCGESVTPNAKFCSECGKQIERRKFCPKCKTEKLPKAKFCDECGGPLSSNLPDDQPKNADNRKPTFETEETSYPEQANTLTYDKASQPNIKKDETDFATKPQDTTEPKHTANNSKTKSKIRQGEETKTKIKEKALKKGQRSQKDTASARKEESTLASVASDELKSAMQPSISESHKQKDPGTKPSTAAPLKTEHMDVKHPEGPTAHQTEDVQMNSQFHEKDTDPGEMTEKDPKIPGRNTSGKNNSDKEKLKGEKEGETEKQRNTQAAAGTEKQPTVHVVKDDRSSRSSNRNFGDETINVDFRVLISKDLDFDRNKHTIEIRSMDLNHDWSKPGFEMQFSRHVESLPLMTTTLQIPKSLITRKQVCYKYLKKSKKLGKKNFTWEYLYEGGYNQYHANRKLSITQDQVKKQSYWIQYDGVIHGEASADKRSLVGKLYDAVIRNDPEKYLIKESQIALSAALADIKDIEKTTGASMIQEISHIRNQLLDRNFLSFNKSAFLEVILEYVSGNVKKIQKLRNSKKENESRHCLALAVTTSCLWIQHQIPLEKEKDKLLILIDALVIRFNDKAMVCEEYERLESVHFPDKNSRKEAAECIQNAIRKLSSHGNCNWVKMVPLFHFLTGESKPFIPVKLVEKHANKKWWGTRGIDDEVDALKDQLKDQRDVARQLFDVLVPLFQVDYLLQRFFMATLFWKDLSEILATCKINTVVCLANMWFFIHSRKIYDPDMRTLPQLLEHVRRKTDMEIEELNSRRQGVKPSIEDCEAECKIAMDFLLAVIEYATKTTKSWEHEECIYGACEVADRVIDKLEELKSNSKEEKQSSIQTTIKSLRKQVVEQAMLWYEKGLPYKLLSWNTWKNTWSFSNQREIEVLNQFLHKVDCRKMDSRNLWFNGFLSIFKERVQKEMPKQRLAIFCQLENKKYHKAIEDCLTKIAFEVVETSKTEQFGEYSFIFSYVHGGSNKIGAMICKLLEKEWPEAKETATVVRHMLTWPTYLRYLEMFYGQTDNESLLNDNCAFILLSSLSTLEECWRQLLTGDIDLILMRLILDNRQKFVEIVEFWKKSEKKESVDANYLLDVRLAEVQTFDEMKSQLAVFASYCNQLDGVDIKTLQFHISDNPKALKDICDPAELFDTKEKNIKAQPPKITKFDVDREVFSVIPDLKRLKDSLVFVELSKKHAKNALKKKPALVCTDVLNSVFKQADNELVEIIRQLEHGSITLEKIDKIFHIFGQNYDCLSAELHVICSSCEAPWISKRLKQIKDYHQLTRYRKGATILRKIKESFNLTGDFSTLDVLTEASTEKDLPLHKINADVVKAGQELVNIGEDEANCIETFHKCQEFVQWLKTSVTDAKEMKTLVDLAMMSAQGQSDMEVEKVACLYASASGYAPLIYELEPASDFKTLLKQCQQVWKFLKTDKDLPTKLMDTSRNLEWLRYVKESLGSVEVDSFSQVSSINAKGIYEVGYLTKRKAPKSANDVPANVVRLTLEKKHYSFRQLCDLQDKLMLVAGKKDKGEGSEQVDRFVEIFDAVTRLAKWYIKLCSAGCVLFKKWNVRFYCEERRGVHTEIDFGLTERNVLRGYKRHMGNVFKAVTQVCDFAERCYEAWIKDITNKRDEFYYLNNYTTEQVVTLCTEIAKFCVGDKNFSQRIFPMLNSVKTNCKRADLEKAIESAWRDIEYMGNPDLESEDDEPKTSAEEEMDADRKRRLLAFYEAVQEAGYSERMAERALAAVGEPEKIDEGVMWCFEHEEEDTLTNLPESPEGSDPESETQHSPDLKKLVQTETLEEIKAALLTNATDNTSEVLKTTLEKIWEQYMETSSTRSVADFLSVQHLGRILLHLAAEDSGAIPRRILPSSCVSGKANMIICQEKEVHQVTLSMYMEGEGKDNPLPTATEVLLCTNKTRAEEVELLLRRAFGDFGKEKLFCLVNADKLDYEACVHIEKFYENHAKGNSDFQLVLICGKENEDKSSIVTAFERCRVTTPILQDVDQIKEYLEKRLRTETHLKPSPAAVLDPTNCTVRIVKSKRAGVGKSLYALRLAERMQTLNPGLIHDTYERINLHRKAIDTSEVVQEFFKDEQQPEEPKPRLFHIDIAHEVQDGIDDFLFNLVVLGSLTDNAGFVWTRSLYDLYVIECMPIMRKEQKEIHGRRAAGVTLCNVHQIFQFLPSIQCWSPTESKEILSVPQGEIVPDKFSDYTTNDQLMDLREFTSPVWQRVYQYLDQSDKNGNFDVNPELPSGSAHHCISTLLIYCGLNDPSWTELRHFVWFLNLQLRHSDESIFFDPSFAEDLPGIKCFIIKCMIQMSRDFATRSLDLSEESPSLLQQMTEAKEEDKGLAQFQLKRRWESSPHPYVFFNDDRISITFLGFNITKDGDMVDHQTKKVLEHRVMKADLQEALKTNGAPLNENFDRLTKIQKVNKIRRVMGIPEDIENEVDTSYVLTTDNVKKIMAIYMRFRCGIPVIIMGETGCGKTRLIKYMCDLQKQAQPEIQNVILMKVHGGTTAEDIMRNLEKARQIAERNKQISPNIDTVLFFDEANATEEIGLIKRVMVDQEYLIAENNLRIVAACNPYRKHSEEMIKRLEQAGLGYHIQADETVDKLGHVPMRRLVYRVQALPQSMLPLVWDFGKLDMETEKEYIKEMVNKCVSEEGDAGLPVLPNLENVLSDILAASQEFMRNQDSECSFVSLRDVERVLLVMCWFYKHKDIIFPRMNELGIEKLREEEKDEEYQELCVVTRSLVLALGVCYHACLENRLKYRKKVAPLFRAPLMNVTEDVIYQEINGCQEVFLNEIKLQDNIARNNALKENVFMMIVCIELRIPLFLVGKPGSSKSLAKTIVADAMQGDRSRSELFKALKSIHMVSFQCSPLATPAGIVGTFRQCADLQKRQDLEKFVSVVVLDEIGLAEDSPLMPLKTLHPLLEDGCEGDQTPEPYMKVAFIGISNWALDPAKMNRGILVQRGVPDVEELVHSGKGICATDKIIQARMNDIMRPMAEAYLKLYSQALQVREFFGLRDFYSIIKMIYGFTKRSGKAPTWYELKFSILSNFGGLDDVDPIAVFKQELTTIDKEEQRSPDDPNCSPAGLIRACLFGEGLQNMNIESRYLLILTENYAALKILQQQLLLKTEEGKRDMQYIFGSSFPKDQEYTQVCRNINKIKIRMETGKTVVLMNLENLYESLYDALNQYYVYLGGQRFVDLGLGTHRVKCKVHKHFRLIVVAEKEVVYKKFPIPLINRLEKHTLTMETMLTDKQLEMSKQLQQWAEAFLPKNKHILPPSQSTRSDRSTELGDTFIGYEKDTAASVVLQVSSPFDDLFDENYGAIMRRCKEVLLQCATPEAIVRLGESDLAKEEEEISDIYFSRQHHENILQFIHHFICKGNKREIFAQITTHSKLLSNMEMTGASSRLGINNVQLESLQAFDTEQQFRKQIVDYFRQELPVDEQSILILQCDSGNENSTLIASARYIIADEWHDQKHAISSQKHVLFVIQLPRKKGGCFTGFEGGRWLSYHIDDLRLDSKKLPNVQALRNKTVSALFTPVAKTTAEHDRIVAEEDQKKRMDCMEMPSLDVEEMIRACLHRAAGILQDLDELKERKTERVRLLVHILDTTPADSNFSLVRVLQKRLWLLLKDKEDTVMSFTKVRSWLSKEAASLDSIVTAGTFRRAVWQHLEQKVTPLLAGIIGYSDANSNLDLLCDSAKGNWVKKLWILMLDADDVTRLKYQDLKHTTRTIELDYIQIHHHGFEGAHFRNNVPFSWVIKRYIDQLIHITKQNAADTNPEQTVEKLFSQSEIGRTVQHAFQDETEYDEYLEYYKKDFIKMMYGCRTENKNDEYEMVNQSILAAATKGLTANEDNSEKRITETRLHFIYRSIEIRLQLFSQALSLSPKVICATRSNRVDEKTLNSTSEMVLDVKALLTLLEELEPTKDLFSKSEGRRSWVVKVERYRPFVERMRDIIQLSPPDMHPYGEACQTIFQACKEIWSRVCVLKLFLENVCATSKKDEKKFTTDLCMPLWLIFDKKTDFKTAATFKKTESFLRRCSFNSYKHYLGEMKNCPACDNQLEERMQMPCKLSHVVCATCVTQYQSLGINMCPVCREELPEGFEAKEDSNPDIASLKEYKDYKKRCNSFFMDIVSCMCFAGNEPPEAEVIEILLGYITKDPGIENQSDENAKLLTRNMQICKDTIDPTPVVRSFLLQLILRYSVMDVKIYLDKYFQKAKRVVDNEHVLQLSLLFVHCIEDSLHSQYQRKSSKESQIAFITSLLQQSENKIVSQESKMDKFEAIASIRLGLDVAASCMHDVYCSREESQYKLCHIKGLVDAVENVCKKNGFSWPRIYLLRLLNKRYGMDALHILSDIPDLSWIMPEEAKPNPDQVRLPGDRFLAYGEEYAAVKKTVKIALLSDDSRHPLRVDSKENGRQPKGDIMDALAAHREIMAYLFENELKFLPEEKQKLLSDELGVPVAITATKLPFLKTLNYKNNTEFMIGELLVHLFVVLNRVEDDNRFLHPFKMISIFSERMQAAFLPTMHQDNFQDILNANLVGGTTYYKCPNGHLYVVGDCGNVVMAAKCFCGAEVGGQEYGKPSVGNVRLTLEDAKARGDTTSKGHILGDANSRSIDPTPERNLSPAGTTILRLLTHLSMYLGACTQLVEIANMILPSIKNENVMKFLMDHIKCDLNVLVKALDKNEEDCCLFIHILLVLSLECSQDETLDASLNSKKSREVWETRFSETIIIPCIKDIEILIPERTDLILQDLKFDTDPLLRLLHERREDAAHLQSHEIEHSTKMWQLRRRITLQNLVQAFDEQPDPEIKQNCKVLSLFLEKEHLLRVLRNVPTILRLQHSLIRKYSNTIDAADGRRITVNNVLQSLEKGPIRDEFEEMLHTFQQTWIAIKAELSTFVCGRNKIPEEYLNIDVLNFDDMPLSMLLPNWRDEGICAIAVLFFLGSVQNDFLENYGRLTRKSVHKGIGIHNSSFVHLVTYHPDRDLLPIITAHCTYELVKGRDLAQDYDFLNLQRQIVELFVKGKIRLEPIIEFMTYREDFTNKKAFSDLKEIIPQEPLPPDVAEQIGEEYRHITDISQSLSLLDVAINYLISVGKDPQMSLRDFMENTLSLKKPLHSDLAQRRCRLKHVLSLWCLLSHVKAKRLVRLDHDPFDSVSKSYKEPLSQEMKGLLHQALNPNNVTAFMAELHEYVIMEISFKAESNEADEDAVDDTNYPLGFCLKDYMESKKEVKPLLLLEEERFPVEFTLKHCTQVWIEAYEFLRQTGRKS